MKIFWNNIYNKFRYYKKYYSDRNYISYKSWEKDNNKIKYNIVNKLI